MKKAMFFLTSFSLLFGGEILLIDHDGNGTLDDGTPYEQIMINSLSNLGYVYKIWDYQTKGTPPLDTLLNYKAIIWNNACYFGTFSAADTQVMYQYLLQGGKLFLHGSDALYNLEFGPGIPSYLGVSAYQESDFANRTATGIPGAPYFEGFTMNFDDFSNNSNQYGFQDIIQLAPGTVKLMVVNYHPINISDSCILYYKEFPNVTDTGRFVFLTASFEDMIPPYKRDTLVYKIIEGLLKYVKPLLPDLSIDSLYPYEIAFDSIHPVKDPYELFSYTADVINKGAIASDISIIILKITDLSPLNTIFADTEYIPSLIPFEKTSISFLPVYYNVPDTYEIKVEIITSLDASPQNNVFVDTFITLYMPFWDDFESAEKTNLKWEPGFERTSERAISGSYSFCEKANAFYPNMARIYSKNRVPLNLSVFKSLKLSYWVFYDIEEGFDFAYIDVSNDGVHFTNIKKYTGYAPFWKKEVLDISGLLGAESAYVRLRFESDPGLNRPGIFFDDFVIIGELKDRGAPFIIFKEPPDTVSFYGNKVLKAKIIERNILSEALLKYVEESVLGATLSVSYDSVKNDIYYFTLPYLGAGKRIYYSFEATDIKGNKGRTPFYEKVQGKLLYNHDPIKNPSIVILGNGIRVATGFVVGADSLKLTSIIYLTYSDDQTPVDTLLIEVFGSDGGMPSPAPIISFKDYPENTPQRRYSWNLAPLPSPLKFNYNDTFYIGIKCIRPSGLPVVAMEDYQPSSERSFLYDGTSWQPLRDINSNHPADPLFFGVCEIYGGTSYTDIKEFEKKEIKVFYSNEGPFISVYGINSPFKIRIFDVQGRKIKELKLAGNKKEILNIKRKGIYFIVPDKKIGVKKIIYFK